MFHIGRFVSKLSNIEHFFSFAWTRVNLFNTLQYFIVLLDHCPSLSLWHPLGSKTLNQIVSVFWNTFTSCVTIPFTDNFFNQNPGTDLELLLPREKRVKRAYHPLKVRTQIPKVAFSLPFLVTTISDVFKPVDWSRQRHICGESLRSEVDCDCTLHLGRDGSINRS